VPVAEPPEGGTAGGDPAEREPDLWSAVAALPDKQRLSVAYHYLGGLPYAQVADLLGGTADAARRAAADGIKRLRAVPGLSPAVPREGATR
jgi:DNA-directed RNA polymerase specialized sigma24 family protein